MPAALYAAREPAPHSEGTWTRRPWGITPRADCASAGNALPPWDAGGSRPWAGGWPGHDGDPCISLLPPPALMFPAWAEPLGWVEMFTVRVLGLVANNLHPLKEKRPLLHLCAIFNFVD